MEEDKEETTVVASVEEGHLFLAEIKRIMVSTKSMESVDIAQIKTTSLDQ